MFNFFKEKLMIGTVYKSTGSWYKVKLENGKFSTVISHDNQFSVLKLCDKKNELNQVEKRNKIQNNLYAKKFNQLASTFIANLRKNANIKYFNK